MTKPKKGRAIRMRPETVEPWKKLQALLLDKLSDAVASGRTDGSGIRFYKGQIADSEILDIAVDLTLMVLGDPDAGSDLTFEALPDRPPVSPTDEELLAMTEQVVEDAASALERVERYIENRRALTRQMRPQIPPWTDSE